MIRLRTEEEALLRRRFELGVSFGAGVLVGIAGLTIAILWGIA